MNLDNFKTLEHLADALKPLLSGSRNFSALNVGPVGSPPTAGDVDIDDDLHVGGNLTVDGSGLVTNGNSHNHYGGDGGDILEESLESQVTGKLVTGGNSHDHDGGDGGTIPAGGIGSNTIDDTKVGNRVPQFYRRQGGSSSSWQSAGNSNYTPGAVRIQAGVKTAAAGTTTNVVFPVSFSNTPIVLISPAELSTAFHHQSVTSSGFTINNGHAFPVICSWIAIGPE